MLSIDFGTSNTAAAYAVDGGAPRPIRLGSNADFIPSCVWRHPQGTQVGDPARNGMRRAPQLFVEHPKAELGRGSVLLGDEEVPVVDLVAEVLKAVVRKSLPIRNGVAPSGIILTHPQAWAGERLTALLAAWRQVGIPAPVRLVSEPIAAVSKLALAGAAPTGARVAVVDYGGGTCDVAVLEVTGDRATPLRVIGHGGEPELGGRAVDRMLLGWVRRQLSQDHPEIDRALGARENLGELRTFMERVREAKETLSESEFAIVDVSVAGLSTQLMVTITEFNQLVAPEIAKLRALVESVLHRAGVAPTDLHALYLTGGSAAIRAVHGELSRLLSGRPATLEDPKLVVALGAHYAPNGATRHHPPRPQPAPGEGAAKPSGSAAVDVRPQADRPGKSGWRLLEPTMWIDTTAVSAIFRTGHYAAARGPFGGLRQPEIAREEAGTAVSGPEGTVVAVDIPSTTQITLEPPAVVGFLAEMLSTTSDDLTPLAPAQPATVLGAQGFIVGFGRRSTGERIWAAATRTGTPDRFAHIVVAVSPPVVGRAPSSLGPGVDQQLRQRLERTTARPPATPRPGYYGPEAAVFGPPGEQKEYAHVVVSRGQQRYALYVNRLPELNEVPPEEAVREMMAETPLSARRSETRELAWGSVRVIGGADNTGANPIVLVGAAGIHRGRHVGLTVAARYEAWRFGGHPDPWEYCLPLLQAVRLDTMLGLRLPPRPAFPAESGRPGYDPAQVNRALTWLESLPRTEAAVKKALGWLPTLQFSSAPGGYTPGWVDRHLDAVGAALTGMLARRPSG